MAAITGVRGCFRLCRGWMGWGGWRMGGGFSLGSARSPFGTFAERTVAAGAMCLELPDGLEDAVAAGLANPAMSSWAALRARAKFVAGESVLILGATGVAGQLAVQIARRLGAKRVIAAGRNPVALERLKALGADVVISLEQESAALVEAFRGEIAGGVDVVLDYLWGAPAESVLAAIAKKGLSHSSPRIRFVQIGNSAGPTITLAGATLRSSGVELLGSGFGSASLAEIFAAVREFFKEAAARPFDVEIKAVPLKDVEAVWGGVEKGDSGCVSALMAVPLPPCVLRKIFKTLKIGPDLGGRRSKKSYKMGLVAAKSS